MRKAGNKTGRGPAGCYEEHLRGPGQSGRRELPAIACLVLVCFVYYKFIVTNRLDLKLESFANITNDRHTPYNKVVLV